MGGGEVERVNSYRNEFRQMLGELVFRPGETSQTDMVFLGQDSRHEPDEFFLVKLSNARGADIADGEGVMTIVDDD